MAQRKQTEGGAAAPPKTNEIQTRAGAPLALRREYRAPRGVHLTEAGIVALENWRGMVDGVRVHVYRGAQLDALPTAVLDTIDKRIPFGHITLKDLGLKPQRTEIINRVPATQAGVSL